ncbi:MAG: hypothetical protein ABIN58_01035 [candidate division WOR-3 bacterium]
MEKAGTRYRAAGLVDPFRRLSQCPTFCQPDAGSTRRLPCHTCEKGNGRVLIYIHEEQMLGEVGRLDPARYNIKVDDRLRILKTTRRIRGDGLTRVLGRQGHYAVDLNAISTFPAADLTIGHIGDLVGDDLAANPNEDWHV